MRMFLLILQLFSLAVQTGILVMLFCMVTSWWTLWRRHNERITRIERIYGIYNHEDAKKYDAAIERMESIHRDWMNGGRPQ
jgi:hypothetical protein